MLTNCKEIFMLSKSKTKLKKNKQKNERNETKSIKLVNFKLQERETNNRT